MTIHTDTDKLNKYTPGRYPSLPGGDAAYITDELRRIGNALNKVVDVVKLIEKRLNDNSLT